MWLNARQPRSRYTGSMNQLRDASPHCPNCNMPMHLLRVEPRLGGLPELRTFECRPCGLVITQAVEDFVRHRG
jgi:hypothetical protein